MLKNIETEEHISVGSDRSILVYLLL